jgi:hypothetical protein
VRPAASFAFAPARPARYSGSCHRPTTKGVVISGAPSNLPDPLESQSGPTTGADDLLAQLAGDEIDRLLTEADVEPAAAPGPPASPAAADAKLAEAPPAVAPAGIESDLDEVFNALEQPAPAAAEPARAPVTATDLDGQLEKLANELLPPVETEEALAPAVAQAKADLPAAEPATEERDALLAAAPEVAAAPSPAVEDEEGPAPWYLRPLVWINAPFAGFSDPVRELIGKVALATILFSIAVLAFIAATRHKL